MAAQGGLAFNEYHTGPCSGQSEGCGDARYSASHDKHFLRYRDGRACA